MFHGSNQRTGISEGPSALRIIGGGRRGQSVVALVMPISIL